MKTITFLNNKGGVGKTASVTTVAHILSSVHNKKVLIVDLDPQGNTSSMFSDIDFLEIFRSIRTGVSEKKEYSVEDLLLDSAMDTHKAIHHTDYAGLDIIPAYLTLSEIEERLKADIKTPQQFKLKMHLEKIKDEYDFCIIDCSPSISLLNINGLVASDEVYIPTLADAGSVLGIAIVMNLIETVSAYNPKLKVAGAFFTRYQGHKNVSKTVYSLLEQILPPGILLPITVGISKFLEENAFQQAPLLIVDSGKNKSKATQGYLKLAGYIVAPNRKAYLKELRKSE